MKGELIRYIDQYGASIWASTVKELRERCGGGTSRSCIETSGTGAPCVRATSSAIDGSVPIARSRWRHEHHVRFHSIEPWQRRHGLPQ
jgi:hypothetical protein